MIHASEPTFELNSPSGILDSDDFNSEDDPNDEVLAELRKKQQELRVLSQHNLMVTKRLYKMAKEEMQRQELRKKMATADADVSLFSLVYTCCGAVMAKFCI